MTDRPESPDDVAAWLEVVAGAAAPRLVALGSGECLALAAAVLAAAARQEMADAPGRCLDDALASVRDRVPALAAWATALVDRLAHGRPGETPPGVDDAAILDRLAASLVIPGTPRAIAIAGQTAPVAEAAVLRDAVAVVREQFRRRADGGRAVAEARLEAMRELAYGAGHEINNPLANIATRAQGMLLEEVDPERRRRLSTIVDQSFRARDMIGGLMLFARPPRPRAEAVDVGGIVAAAIEAVRGQAVARGARLEYSPPPVPIAVCVDRVQIEEVLRLLVVNALEAVTPGGRVMLEARRRMQEEGWCEITIVDDGHGMTAETARRAFDPFFSGREAGRGMGMGLPKVWRLVELNGGSVSLESSPAGGTRLLVLLPEVVATVAAGEAACGRQTP